MSNLPAPGQHHQATSQHRDTIPAPGSQASNVGVHDRRDGISRYGDVGHAIVNRAKEKHSAPHSETLGGNGPTVSDPHAGLRASGSRPDNEAAHHSRSHGSQPRHDDPSGGARPHFIADAIKRPGALTRAVGGPPGQRVKKVRSLAAHGTPLQRREANFYLNVLAKARR